MRLSWGVTPQALFFRRASRALDLSTVDTELKHGVNDRLVITDLATQLNDF